MKSTRRKFLINSTGAVVMTGLLPSCWNISKPYLFISASHSEMHSRSDTEDRKSDPYLAVFDSRTNSTNLIQVPSYIHSITQNPREKLEFLCLPKLGNTGFIYDHKDGAIRELKCEDGFLFYGHGTYSRDAKSIYTAQSLDGNITNIFTRSSYKGTIAEYSTTDLKTKSDLDSYGNDPHDMKFLDGDRVVIANGGTGTNISIVNLKDGSLEKQFPCDLQGISCRHLLLDGANIYVLSMVNSSDKRQISHLLYPENGKLVPFGGTMIVEDRLKTQLLSGESTDNFIITTAPLMNAVHIWDKNSHQLVKVEDFEQAAGVALSLDKSKCIVTSRYENDALEFSASTSRKMGTNNNFKQFSGSHTLLAEI